MKRNNKKRDYLGRALIMIGAGLTLAAGILGQAPTTTPDAAKAPGTEQRQTILPPGLELKNALPKPPEEQINTEEGAEKILKDAGLPSTQTKPVPPRPEVKRLGTSGAVLALSLEDAVKVALENNNDIEIARDDVQLAETGLKALRGAYDPVLNITPTFDYSVVPNANLIGGSRTNPGRVWQTDFVIGSSVNQALTKGGGSYSAYFNNLYRSTDSALSALDPYSSSSLGVTFTQPLFRNRRIDRTRHDIKVQSKRISQSDNDFRRRTIDVIADVQVAYWNLVFAIRDQQNRMYNIDLVREQFRNVEGRIGQGTGAPLERVQVEAELARQQNELLRAVKAVSLAENQLKQLMLPNPLVPEWSAELMPTDKPEIDNTTVNLDDMLKTARENRPEMERLKNEQDINEIDRRYLKDQTRPRVDLSASVISSGLAGTPVTGSLISGATPLPSSYTGNYGQTLGNLAGFDNRSVVVGVTIEIPLRNRTAREQYAGAEIRKRQLQSSTASLEQIVEMEVRNAAQSLETARQSIDRAREARSAAEVQLAGEQQLFRSGNSTTFLVFERTNQLINARTSELAAETDYSSALANLQRATGTTLKEMKVSIEPRDNKTPPFGRKTATSGLGAGNYILPPREASTEAALRP